MPEALQVGLFEGRSVYGDALKQVLLQACAQGSREIICYAESFVDWPLSDAEILDSLAQWARRSRRLKLLALQYEDLVQRHPRFVRWRVTFDHCVEARAFEQEGGQRDGLAAALLVLGGERAISLRLFDSQMWRGAVSVETADVLRAKEWIDALAPRSCLSFASTTLGL